MAAEAVPGKSHTHQHEINTNSSVHKNRNPTIREVLSQIENQEYRSVEHLVSLLIVVWTSIADKVDTFHDAQSIFKFAHRETAKVVLSGSWPKVNQIYRRGLARALIQSSQMLGRRVENSANLCSSLVMTIYDPWGDPAISQLIKNEDIDEKIVADFVVSEPTELMLLRIEYLVSASLEDCAIRLCRFCLKNEGLAKVNTPKDDFSENWKLPFMEWLLQLLFRRRQLNELIADCANFSCHDGLALILRVQKSRKIDSEALAETLINLFLIRNLLFQKTYCCTRELMRLWCNCQIRKQCSLEEVQAGARKLIVGHAKSSAHFYVFVDMLWEKYGIALLPLYLEFFVRGLTSDLNFLEAARQADAKECIIEMENHMASVYFKLSSLFVDINNDISMECMLSSFSLNPTREKLDIMKKLSMQIAMAKVNRSSLCHTMNSLTKDGRLRPILTNCIVTKRNPVIMCDRGIQVGESAPVNSGPHGDSSKNERTTKAKCQATVQSQSEYIVVSDNNDDNMKVITELINSCIEDIEHELNKSHLAKVLVNETSFETVSLSCDKEKVQANAQISKLTTSKDITKTLPKGKFPLSSGIHNNIVKKHPVKDKLSAVAEVLADMIDTVVNKYISNNDLILQALSKDPVKKICNDENLNSKVITSHGKYRLDLKNGNHAADNVEECLAVVPETKSLSSNGIKKTNEEAPHKCDCCSLLVCQCDSSHQNQKVQPILNGDITDDENRDLHKTDDLVKIRDYGMIEKDSCKVANHCDNNKTTCDNNKFCDKVIGQRDLPGNNVAKFDDTLCRQYLTFRQTHNHEMKGLSLDKASSSYPLHHRVMNAKVPGVPSSLLADFVIVLESLRNPQLKLTNRWTEIKTACESYMETVSSMRKVFMNTQLKGSIYSDDSMSEIMPLGKLEFASFHSDDSVYQDPNIDKSPILRRFLNHDEDIRFSTYVNLSDIHQPYLDLDRLFCIGAAANPHEHGKHHRRHRDKGRDAKKGVLKQLLHNSGYNHELTKRKKKKRKRGRKEKSHNKKHHSNHNKGSRNDGANKKKRNRGKKKKSLAIDLAGGEYCSDFSSTELMRLVNEHSHSFPQMSSSQAIRQTVASASESCSGSNALPKKKRKQVTFKKVKDKKNALVKSHDKHRHSKSKRSKKKTEDAKNVKTVQDYSHIVEFSSVKQMQSVRIRQSSVSVDLSKVPKMAKKDGISLQGSECDVNRMPTGMNSALNSCGEDDMRKIQMLLVNKQSSPAVCVRDPFEEKLLYNKQTVLKYVSSKTTSHLLSVAQASNRVLVQNPGASSAIKSLSSTQSLLPSTGKYVISSQPVNMCRPSTSQALATFTRGSTNVHSANSPVITTLTFPMNQGNASGSGTKIISGKLMIPLGGTVSSTVANVKPIMSNVVVPAGSSLYQTPNVIIMKKGNDTFQVPVNSQQLQNILPSTSTVSKFPIAVNRSRNMIMNKSLPNTARKVVKKYTQPYFAKKSPAAVNKPPTDQSIVVSGKSPETPLATTVSSEPKIYQPPADTSEKSETLRAEEEVNVTIETNDEVAVKENSISEAKGNEPLNKENSETLSVSPSASEIAEENIIKKKISDACKETDNANLMEIRKSKSQSLEFDSHPPDEQLDTKLDDEDVAETVKTDDTKPASEVEEANSSADASLLKPSDDDSNDESINDDEDDESMSVPSSPKSASIPTMSDSKSDLGNEEPSESPSERNMLIASVSIPDKFTTIDITQIAHKTQLQPLSSINGTKLHPAACKSDAVSQSEAPTRSLTSISDAVRFSLMDMDDATGSVENQVLQAFHSFPQEAVAFVTQETTNVSESTITTLTTSSNLITTHSSQTYQAAVCTSQRETFTECQMTASTSTSREWNASDPAALVSSILAAKSLETDSASELKDEERIKKKRKKKERTEKDPDAIQRFWCELCNRGFFSAYNLRRHCRNVHKMDLPKGSSDVPFTSSSTQCLTLVGDRVICSAVSEAGTQSVTVPISGGNKTPEFIMQSPTSDPKTKEFSHQTSPQSHTKQIQQQVSQALNQSPNFNLHSPPISPITPPKDFRMQTGAVASISQAQQTNFMNVGANLPKPVPKFQMIQTSHAPGPAHTAARLSSVHPPVVSAPSQMITQPRLIQPGALLQKPAEIQTTNIVQPLPCQVQQIQQNVQCPLAQNKKTDQRPVMLSTVQHEAQEQALRIARHTAEVQAQHKAIQQQQQQAFKKNVQLSKSDTLLQVPIQISQAAAISHIQPPILNPQMQKLVQIRQAALCRSPEFTLQLPVQGSADAHTLPVKSPIQYFQAQVSGPQHQSVLHSAVRQTLASCAAVRQANPSYIGQPIQNIANAEFLSRLVPHAAQERPSCAQPFSGIPGTDLCLVSNQPHTQVIRQSTETSEGLEDLEQFLLENMAWSGGGELTSQVQQSLNRPGVNAVSLPIAVKQAVGAMQQAKGNPLGRSKPTVTKPKACKPTIAAASKNFAAKSCQSKKKSCATKKNQELGCAESLKTGFASVPPIPIKKNCGNKAVEGQCEKSIGCCMVTNPSKEVGTSCSVDENDSISSDSVQCIEMTRNNVNLKGVNAAVVTNFSTLPKAEVKTPGFYKVPTFCNPGVRTSEHLPNSNAGFGIAVNAPVSNVGIAASQPLVSLPVSKTQTSKSSVLESSNTLNTRHAYTFNSNNANFPNPKCHDNIIGCAPKPVLPDNKTPVVIEKQNDSPPCISKDAVDPVVPIYETSTLQNDNLDAEKELKNLQSKISDCEKHLKNSENNSKESEMTNNSATADEGFRLVPKEKPHETIPKNDVSGNLSKNMSFLSSDKIPTTGIGTSAERTSDSVQRSPSVVESSTKGIHFLDDQNTTTSVENAAYHTFGSDSFQAKDATVNSTSHSFNAGPKNLHSIGLPEKVNHCNYTNNAAIVSDKSTFRTASDNQHLELPSMVPSNDVNNMVDSHQNVIPPLIGGTLNVDKEPPVDSKVCNSNNGIFSGIEKSNNNTVPLHSVQGYKTPENGISDYPTNINLSTSRIMMPNVIITGDNQNHIVENSVSMTATVTEDNLHTVLRQSDNEPNVVNSGRTRLRDMPKTSVKRSCPCCTDTCPPKKCRTNASNNMSIFFAKLPKTTPNVKPNGPQKPKNIVAFKAKNSLNPSVQVKTRSSHRLRSRNGSVT